MSHESMYELRKRQLASCPGTSHVLLRRLAEDERRDCVDAHRDAAELADLLDLRCNEALASAAVASIHALPIEFPSVAPSRSPTTADSTGSRCGRTLMMIATPCWELPLRRLH